jgi:murein DD-endopeptidase MepM/ murein hydrolase activator NlpD
VTDDFIARVIPPILANSPEISDLHDPLKNFVEVNRDLRRVNAEKLVEVARESQPQFLWHGAFKQLGNSAVEAHFADHRIYKYRGQTIDEEDHLGYDLAAILHTPVLAANSGRVVMASYFGIYGNTVVLDHGFGLLSLYAHMNDFAVKPGDSVRSGQLLGHSDSTGMAGGDHLHFSTLLGGVQVDPKEWWDPHWIHDRVETKLQQFGGTPAQAR